jgi:hypothetical protein
MEFGGIATAEWGLGGVTDVDIVGGGSIRVVMF